MTFLARKPNVQRPTEIAISRQQHPGRPRARINLDSTCGQNCEGIDRVLTRPFASAFPLH